MSLDEEALFAKYAQAFEREDEPPDPYEPEPPPLCSPRRRRSMREIGCFYLANMGLMPLIAISYQVVGAEGLRSQMDILGTKLYRLPVPGISKISEIDGLERADVSQVLAFIAFCATAYVWMRVFQELYGLGDIREQRQRNPALFWALCIIAVLVVTGDSIVFYLGLSAQSSGWGGSAGPWVPLAATGFWMTGIAALGAWHADFYAGKGA